MWWLINDIIMINYDMMINFRWLYPMEIYDFMLKYQRLNFKQVNLNP